MFYVYLLKSRIDSYFYIGFTSDLKKRVKEHNQGKTKSTKHKTPFDLIYYESYNNKTDARKRELQLKNNSYKKKQLLQNLENSLK